MASCAESLCQLVIHSWLQLACAEAACLTNLQGRSCVAVRVAATMILLSLMTFLLSFLRAKPHLQESINFLLSFRTSFSYLFR